jgi:hypothetical protein
MIYTENKLIPDYLQSFSLKIRREETVEET